MAVDLDELTAEQTLDAVESLHAAVVAAETRTFVLAAHFADLHSSDTVQPGATRPGMERAIRIGGSGTPRIAEFMMAEFGARMQWGPFAARRYIADALDCRHRLPRIWARVVAGEVRVTWARMVASATHELSLTAAARVDAAMCRSADGRISRSRFETMLAGEVYAADPARAAAKEAEEAAKEYARAGRSTEHGMRGFHVRAPLGVIARLDATVAYVADALKSLGDDDTLDQRRTKAMAILADPLHAVELLAAFAAHRAGSPDQPDRSDRSDDPPLPPDPADDPAENGDADGDACADTGSALAMFCKARPFRPGTLGRELARLSDLLNRPDTDPEGALVPFVFDWRKVLPRAVLYVHTSRTGLENPDGYAVRVEEHGPVTTDWLRQHLGPRIRFTVKPVIDLANQVPVDAYEVPDRHREAVVLRTPAEIFPFSSTPARRAQVDHNEPYDADGGPGQSRLENYGPLGSFTHRVKTFGHWKVRQPFNGIWIWRDPHGRYYLVDSTGTRKLHKA